MADLGGSFNANEVEPSRPFTLLPKGWVEAMIVESNLKMKDAAGNETNDPGAAEKKRLTLVYQMLDERREYKKQDGTGRQLWHGLNLKNPSAMAEQISNGQLSSICRAINVLNPKDSEELHNLPHMILIGQKINKGTGELENVINDWKPKGSVSDVMAAGAAGKLSKPADPASAGAATPGSKPAWLKKAQ